MLYLVDKTAVLTGFPSSLPRTDWRPFHLHAFGNSILQNLLEWNPLPFQDLCTLCTAFSAALNILAMCSWDMSFCSSEPLGFGHSQQTLLTSTPLRLVSDWHHPSTEAKLECEPGSMRQRCSFQAKESMRSNLKVTPMVSKTVAHTWTPKPLKILTRRRKPQFMRRLLGSQRCNSLASYNQETGLLSSNYGVKKAKRPKNNYHILNKILFSFVWKKQLIRKKSSKRLSCIKLRHRAKSSTKHFH